MANWLKLRAPDAAQREAQRSGAPLIRGPAKLIEVPVQQRTGSRCAAPGTRAQ